MTDILVPTLGESVTEATVATWFKKPGDNVSVDEMLCELETDKVTVEVPSPVSGILQTISSPEGTTVGLKALLAVIKETDSKALIDTGPSNQPKPMKSASIAQNETKEEQIHGPAVRKIMKEQNIESSEIKGSGRGGRIIKEDLIDHNVTKHLTKVSGGNDLNASQMIPNKEERVKMSRLRQTIATRLKQAQNTAAMLTTFNEVDMSTIIDIRKKYKTSFEKKHSIKLGFMSFFAKACCHALLEIPEVNAEIDENDVVYKNYVNMAIAVGTPAGLVAPVIKDAHKMSFADIEKALANMGTRAREGTLSIEEMQGGSFTISNGGIYGSLMSSPILNPPQSGILGMHKIQERPIALNDEIVIRPMMYLALSYDHRIVDGKGAVTFLVRVKECLEDPNILLMDL
ncbi:MAG: dihydrolipoyllysine-residue succinyltransferase [Rhodobacteraceae bacterium]|nr:MAG: dihydrolipoyllysine-residue succinyltransferase [Paracoccaceae bacterium]